MKRKSLNPTFSGRVASYALDKLLSLGLPAPIDYANEEPDREHNAKLRRRSRILRYLQRHEELDSKIPVDLWPAYMLVNVWRDVEGLVEPEQSLCAYLAGNGVSNETLITLNRMIDVLNGDPMMALTPIQREGHPTKARRRKTFVHKSRTIKYG